MNRRSPLTLLWLSTSVAILACGFLGCPPSGTGMPGTSGMNGAGDNDNNADDGSGDGSEPAEVVVTLKGATGNEMFMHAVVWVGSRGLTRQEASDSATLAAEGFSLTDLNNSTEPGDFTRTIAVNAGETVTIVAVESEGIYNPINFLDVPPPSDVVVEFVSFSGATYTSTDPGVAVIAPDTDAEVIVNFRRLPQLAVSVWGATAMGIQVDYAPFLALPGGDNPNSPELGGSGSIAAPDPFGFELMQFKTGTEVLLTAAPNGEFLRWDGACAGSGLECTLTFGGPGGLGRSSDYTGHRLQGLCLPGRIQDV